MIGLNRNSTVVKAPLNTAKAAVWRHVTLLGTSLLWAVSLGPWGRSLSKKKCELLPWRHGGQRVLYPAVRSGSIQPQGRYKPTTATNSIPVTPWAAPYAGEDPKNMQCQVKAVASCRVTLIKAGFKEYFVDGIILLPKAIHRATDPSIHPPVSMDHKVGIHLGWNIHSASSLREAL